MEESEIEDMNYNKEFSEIAKTRDVGMGKQFCTVFGRFMLFSYRNPVSVVFLVILAAWNGALESAIFWQIGKYRFPVDATPEEDQTAVMNYMGLAFLASSDIFQIMAFAKIMQMPQIYPVFIREVTNNMYSATSFYFAA